ncbi:MAG: hypothetical protein AMXMBFR64_32820 [Myxococcales bacterium]
MLKTRLLLLALALWPATVAAQPSCMLPPSNAWSSAATNGGTFDATYVTQWEGTSLFDTLFTGLRCDEDDWDEGWGFEDPGDLGLMLSRLMNAAFIVRMVQGYTSTGSLDLPVSDLPEEFKKGRWWDFVSDYGTDEWEPTCSTDSTNASYNQVVDWYYLLFPAGAYRYEAVNRAGTMVHETTHEDVGHIDEKYCTPPTKSCDHQYGEYNSNTMHINFLLDGLVSRRSSGGKLMVAKVDSSTCTYVDMFSEVEQVAMLARANGVNARFMGSVFLPGWLIDQRKAADTWTCESCAPSKWNFIPSQCNQTACNEVLNPANKTINEGNKSACIGYNGSVTSDPATLAEAKAKLDAATKSCQKPTLEAATAYCTAQMDKAQTVADIDACGWLDTTNVAPMDKLTCVQLFCKHWYQETAGEGWGASDPYGCLDYLCQGGECSEDGAPDRCIFGFKLAEGDPANYTPSCQLGGCHDAVIDCVMPLEAAGTWQLGDPIPADCKLKKDLCELATRLAAMVLTSVEPTVDPGPLKWLFDYADITTPAQSYFDYAEKLLGGGLTPTSAYALGLAKSPERVALLYGQAPEAAVWMLGAENLTPIAGPSAGVVTGKAIVAQDLPPAGQAALQQLQTMAAQQPGTPLVTAFGPLAMP